MKKLIEFFEFKYNPPPDSLAYHFRDTVRRWDQRPHSSNFVRVTTLVFDWTKNGMRFK